MEDNVCALENKIDEFQLHRSLDIILFLSELRNRRIQLNSRENMKVLVDIAIYPMGVDLHQMNTLSCLTELIAELEMTDGIMFQTHGNGANITGEWETIQLVIKNAHKKLLDMGVPRLASAIRVMSAVDKELTL